MTEAILSGIILALSAAVLWGYLEARRRGFTRAKGWYALSAWAHSNGDAAVERGRRRSEYLSRVESLAVEGR